MGRARYSESVEEIFRAQGGRPVLVPTPLAPGTLVAHPWQVDPVDAAVSPMKHHVIAATIRGEGHSTVWIDGKEARSPSLDRSVSIIPRGFGARWYCDGRPVVGTIYLARQRLQECGETLGLHAPELLLRVNHQDERLFSIANLITEGNANPDPAQRMYLEALLDAFCVQMVRAHCSQPVLDRPRQGLAPWQVKRVSQHLRDRIEESVALQELADLVGLSRFHFCTAFRKAVGTTPHQYLVMLRIEQAKRLLKEELERSVTDIALSVGYHTPSAFALAFRKATGRSPTQFRIAISA